MTIGDKIIKVSLWDTAGQDRLRAATTSYYRGSLGAFIVYDITNFGSFQNTQKWLDELKQHTDSDISITLVGNKLDLKHLRAVEEVDAIAFATKNSLNFIETSNLDSTNVFEAFQDMVNTIYMKVTQKETLSKQYNKNDNKVNNVVDITTTGDDKENKNSFKNCCNL
jgi:Ras-related protein Rab-11A